MKTVIGENCHRLGPLNKPELLCSSTRLCQLGHIIGGPVCFERLLSVSVAVHWHKIILTIRNFKTFTDSGQKWRTTWAMKVELSAKNFTKSCFLKLKLYFSWSNDACSLRISSLIRSFSHFFCLICSSSSKYFSGRLVLNEHFGNFTTISSLVFKNNEKHNSE